MITSKQVREWIISQREMNGSYFERPITNDNMERLADALEVLEFMEGGGDVMSVSTGFAAGRIEDRKGFNGRGLTPIAAVRAAKGAK